MIRRILALGLALGLALLLASPAAAHAELVRSNPPAGATLDASPPSIELEFSEELDPNFSQVQLVDSQSNVIERGPGEVQPSAPRTLRLILPDLPRGSYAAIWRVRSAADGHITEGSLPFGVGVAAQASSLIPAIGAPDPATIPPPIPDTLARWLNLTAATLALGALPFAVLVWRPAYRRAADQRRPTTDERTIDDRPTTDDRRPTTDDEPTTDERTIDGRPPTTDHGWPTTDGRPPTAVGRTTADDRTIDASPESLDMGYARLVADASLQAPSPKPQAPSPKSKALDWSAADEAITGFLRRQIFYGGLLFLLTNLVFLVVQAAAAANVPIYQAIGAPLIQLLAGRSGMLALARLALVCQLVALAWRLPPAGRGPARLWWVVLAIGAVVVLTLSLTSHAAADPAAAIAVPADWLHIAATVAWLGGLVPFVYAARMARREPERALPLSILTPRFSWLSAPCVAALTLTGVYQYLLHVERLDLLAATTYGRALLVKLGLFAALLLLGALNLLILSRRLRASGNRLARAFGRSVRAELILGALVLLAAGAMTSVAPSVTAWAQHERQGIAQSAEVDGVGLTLRIAPAQIGDNEFAVDVRDPRPGAAAAPTKVLLRFDMIGMQMGVLQAEARPAAEQRYAARGSYTTMGGRWHVEVVLRRAGFDDVRHTFVVDITRSALS